jgi:ADP-dependent NAD(P)H-hydrate dehydratase
MKAISVPHLPDRLPGDHKGRFGHAVVVGGATGMTGAAIIAGRAALRCGAGLVTVAVPNAMQIVAASADPCYMTIGVDWHHADEHLRTLLHTTRYQRCTIAIGPGLGRSSATDSLVRSLYQTWPNTLVCDADALNALSANSPEDRLTQRTSTAKRILTPHPGEWERLCGVDSHDRTGQIEKANVLAAQWNAIIVLKGQKTCVTDGEHCYENHTGNPSLAVGGSGDALTGIIAAMVCQGMNAMDASVLGVYLHGLAADIAHRELGTPSTLATDLIHYLPHAFRSMSDKVLS